MALVLVLALVVVLALVLVLLVKVCRWCWCWRGCWCWTACVGVGVGGIGVGVGVGPLVLAWVEKEEMQEIHQLSSPESGVMAADAAPDLHNFSNKPFFSSNFSPNLLLFFLRITSIISHTNPSFL